MHKKDAKLKPHEKSLQETVFENLLLISEKENELESFLRCLEEFNAVTEQLKAKNITMLDAKTLFEGVSAK